MGVEAQHPWPGDETASSRKGEGDEDPLLVSALELEISPAGLSSSWVLYPGHELLKHTVVWKSQSRHRTKVLLETNQGRANYSSETVQARVCIPILLTQPYNATGQSENSTQAKVQHTAIWKVWPSQTFYIMGNEVCERFSFYGMRAILVGSLPVQLSHLPIVIAQRMSAN